jgi:large subunit ribosomal protein L21
LFLLELSAVVNPRKAARSGGRDVTDRTMYAVIKTGGKQYRVANGDVITVEKLEGEPGDTLALEPVLMLNDGKATTVGAPVVEGASVSAEVVEQTRGDKILVFKKKRRQGYRRTKGHRQDLTVLRVLDVTGKGKKAPAKKKAAAKKDEAPADAAADADTGANEE